MTSKIPKSPKIDRKKCNALCPGLIPYNEKIHQIREMVSELNDSNLKHKQELYQIILPNIVTLIEDTQKHLVREFIDKNGLDISNLIKKNELTDSTISYGTLVATNFNFQNLKELDIVYGSLLNIKFLDLLHDFVLYPSKTGANELFLTTSFEDQNSLKENWDEFQQMLEKRHEIIHTIDKEVTFIIGTERFPKAMHNNKIPKLNIDFIKKMLNCTEVFLFLCMVFPEFVVYYDKHHYVFSEKLSTLITQKLNS